MIYITTALYAEAHGLIARFQLKKDTSHTRFQVFFHKDADICLIVTGVGAAAAATALGGICTESGAGRGDFLLNIGVCAGIVDKDTVGAGNVCRVGEIYLCNKIREQATGKTFYPDILYHHGFAEAQILTGAKPYAGSDPEAIKSGGFYLYDMEAAAVYQAGSYFFGPHQMSFLKVVSDDGEAGRMRGEQVKELIGGNMESIAGYITDLQRIAHEERMGDIFSENGAEKALEQLCRDLCCSQAMAISLRQHICYCILSGVDYGAAAEEMYREGKLPCKDRREGKLRFEELKKRLL